MSDKHERGEVMNIDLILETIGYVGNNKDYSISERLSLIEELVAIIELNS